MTEAGKLGNRNRLLDAATFLLEANPGDDLSLRAVCDSVGVHMPTLYHYFGSKQGLLEAVAARGFDRYLALKNAQPPSGDPIQDLRTGWDQHVAYGLSHPAVYALMWEAVPGRRTPAAELALAALVHQAQRAADQGRLAVSVQEAAEHILAACVGATLYLITAPQLRPQLSSQLREATIVAVTGANRSSPHREAGVQRLAEELALALAETSEAAVGVEERALLLRWLATIARTPTA